MKRRLARVLVGLAAALVLSAGGGALWLRARLAASLPLTIGQRELAGLSAPVRVERDRLGVPVVRGKTRADVARATGFLHAQERFFQMDLLRRRAAGELAELVGAAALPTDREVRVLQLRAVAQRAAQALPSEERALLQAYTEGVAGGLAAQREPPFEYLVLRTQPSPWRPEDALLCALTMYLSLQGGLPRQESLLGLMHDVLPRPLFEFLAVRGTEWDAPLEGVPFQQPAVPGPEVLDLRPRPSPPTSPSARIGPPATRVPPLTRTLAPTVTPPARVTSPALVTPPPMGDAEAFVTATFGRDLGEGSLALGSNNWAVAGSRTQDGAALVANDMHLGISVPNTWYRVSLVLDGEGGERRVTGVTLPGAPFVVVGSNGHVAWGFTNSEGDWADLVVLEPDPDDADAYRTPQGPRRFEHSRETIRVKGGASETLEVLRTIWGPVLDRDHAGRRRALAWVALRDGGLNAALLRMEGARDLAEAQAIAAECGIPNQNFTAGDAQGHVGWTIMGRIPRRFGHDGRLPVSWADGTSGWDGWLPADEYPRIVDPPGGRIWTANARVVDGADLAKVGFGGYDLGARQGQIRDDLLTLDRASEADMLRVQLDDRARFLERWQRHLLELLTPEALADKPLRAEARALVEAWGGHASVDSVGYRIVRAFRLEVAADAFAPLLAPCLEQDPKADYAGKRDDRGYRQFEGPLWALVSAKPAHLLDPRFASWEELQLAALDAVLGELTKDGARLAERTWGERNMARIQHPLSQAIPALGRLIDMPREPLPGDNNMPRVGAPRFGASERMAVSPGHEQRGYFHMPGGQSGNPLSPHYADGQGAWLRGEPTPFLPGPAVEVLTLVPAH